MIARPKRPGFLVSFLVLSVGFVGVAGTAEADSSAVVSTKGGDSWGAAAADGLGNVYLFSGASQQIARFNRETLAIEKVADLPSASVRAAVWDGAGNVHAIANWEESCGCNRVFRFTPSTGTLVMTELSGAHMLRPFDVVWHANTLHVLGDRYGSSVWYRSVSGTAPLQGIATFSDDHTTMVHDGQGNLYVSGCYCDPNSIPLFRVQISPPGPHVLVGYLPVADPHMAWSNGKLLVMGGRDRGEWTRDVWRVNPIGGAAEDTGTDLAHVEEHSAFAWDGVNAFFFRGSTCCSNGPVVRYSLFDAPSAPQNVLADSAGAGRVRVSWEPPASDGGSIVTSYKVYRSSPGGAETLAGSTTARTFLDAGCPFASECTYRVGAANVVGVGERSAATSATARLLPFSLGSEPAGWEERVLLDTRTPPVPVDKDAVTIQGRPNDRTYEITVRVAGQALPTVGVLTGSATPSSVDIELPGDVIRSAHVVVSYRHDPEETGRCAFSVGATCAARVPFDPTDLEWIASEGPAAALVIRVTVETRDGRLVDEVAVVPLAGQLVTAAS